MGMFLSRLTPWRNVCSVFSTLWELLREGLQFLRTISQSRAALAAEILFLRKQLAYYQDHRIRPRRLRDASRLSLWFWSHLFDWQGALVVVKTSTFLRWHRKGFKLYGRWKLPGGRPPLPKQIRQLIARMVRENVTWGEERIADELSLKLGIDVSPRTVRKYWPQPPGMGGGRGRTASPPWKTFVRNHAQGIVACDFLVAVTARFRILFVFLVLEIGSRRILHCNVTAHPTSEWTLQQLRDAIASDHPYQFLIHDRDTIFSSELDAEVKNTFGLRVLRTPVRAPQANAYCERLMGTVRRECLDFIIPLHERHLRGILRSWVAHYNKGRPHSSLGPGTPEPMPRPHLPQLHPRHRLPRDYRITVEDILGGLIMNTSWKSVSLDPGRGFCGAQVLR
jgi:putative transposase